MKKKILYIITKANWGGAQKYVFDLASELRDFDVVVAYGEPFGELNYKLKEKNIKTIKIDGLKRDINIWGEIKVFISLLKIFKKERPDIIHLNSSKIGGLGALAGRLKGVKKIIYTAHGWGFNERRPFWQILLIKFLSWLTIILSHKVIVIAKKEYQNVIKWPFVTNKKLVLIYNGIKPIYFLNKNEAQGFLAKTILQSKMIRPNISDKKCFSGDKIKNDDLIIGTISELTKNKGLKYAIDGFEDIAEKNDKVKFIVIGEGEERKYLEKEIKEEGLENKVFLVGEIKDAQRYLKAFDIFLLSSIKEGLPFVLLEAGLAKLPVIATKVGGVPEIIEDKKSGILIEAKEDDDIEDALEVLIKDEKKRVEYGEELYKVIEEKFTFKRMFEETKGLYINKL
ncbi:MAG: glycosyltransferase family 4 protein [Candidatus Pacebacteria bacterium]|nr:glycosyltransferase family 4 protein [Candidatus Paceibacterota bacterium]